VPRHLVEKYLVDRHLADVMFRRLNYGLIQGTLTEGEGLVRLTSYIRVPCFIKKKMFSISEAANLN